ncbi:serine-protein kinase ATM [Hemicordylus capensis]|uniref:serine-protein kinase ATM n=1 Tax=Hemicordylus capensis TaxID=884348 RepID=UPI0023027CF7|nr:serine-protein kinase ATM [Hemicordylus capensis]XP_053166935.1 serine-protein kinase ATM [Hemicordylus capensis]XP_053166936.1 serine-protein kinase ATM [Hemicordylus capensis]XP_053166937.1 serine-protein kinase ATM [Hemicordylus capensis]
MSLALHDLLACCRQLDSDKATERKKEIEKFRRLIRDSDTVQQLDRNSDSKHGKQMNWDTIFRFLQKYIQKETESARLAKPKVSSSTQASSRQKKMQEISSLVKYFIRCANKRAPRLKCQELLVYVMETVNDPSSYNIYGADCSSILLKDILAVRKYWCEIPSQLWPDLQSLYFRLFLEPSRNINKVLVARIIYTLTRGLCFQTDVLNSNLFSFFSEAVQCARRERNPAGLDYIFAAINIFFSVCAMNYRMRVCKLGEEILPIIVYIWAQHNPKDSLKEQIIQLVQLQVRVHHPNGAKTQEKGAFDSAKWKNVLYSLYDLLANEINLIGSRGKYSSGSRNIALKENLVELMADICHQIFTEDTKVLDISQAYADAQRDCGDAGGQSKRRRIELGWEVIQDNLQRSQNDFDVIPWLQITARLVAKYPMSLPHQELPHLLGILYQLLSQQRRGDRLPYLLRCLKEVALCQSQKVDLKTTQKLEMQRTWSKIWSFVVRSISLQQTEMESFGLLGIIIQRNLITIDREIWKIFSGSACKPSSSAVQCLAIAMTTLTVPETLNIQPVQNNWEGNTVYTLKETIVKWLLFCHLEKDMEDSLELPPVLCSAFPNLVLQKVLVSLTMKNCRAAMAFFHNISECLQHVQDKEAVSLSEIETFYVQTTFEEIDIFINTAVNISEDKLSGSRLAVNQKFKEALEHDLLTMSEQLSSFSQETMPIEVLLRCASLLSGVLGCYCYAGILTEEEACTSKLFHKAKSLMHDVEESISHSKSKLNENSRIVSLRALILQCTSCLCNCTQNSPRKILSGIFLHLLTSKLMNDLTDICKHLMFFTGKPSEAGEVDLMEDDCEETSIEGENRTVLDPLEDHSAESGDVTEAGELQTLTGATSPLAEEHLTKQDLLLLDILKFLCIAVTAAPVQTVCFRAADVRRKLLMLIDGNAFDYIKPLHLHMYLTLLKELPSEENLLPEDDVVLLLKPLPAVCSFYRRDQEVCSAILSNLLPMVTALGIAETNNEDLSEARGQFLTVVGAFWHLANEGKCTAPVRIALVNCMKALLQADPCSEWAMLNVKNEDLPVSDAFPHFLADSNFQVCMVAAKSIKSLFQEVKLRESSPELLKALPLKLQQRAFDNLYLKVQEGTKKLAHGSGDQENLPDEEHNRKSVLLMLITMVLCCSPVCEKQALFAVFQCIKENGLDSQLVRKVLGKVSGTFGYKSVEDFMNTHLDYLVLEWLNCGYSLSVFPYVLLNYSSLEEFYRSCYKVLIPQLVIREQFEEVKSISSKIEKEQQQLLAHCFPKILVNILPYFACQTHEDDDIAQKSETACKVFDMLKEERFLGKQLIDNLFHSNLPEIVVEVLMTLHEPVHLKAGEDADLTRFAGDLDPTPNPPHFPSYVIKATLDYISSCHKTKSKSLVAILSKNPESFQKILLAICKQASGTSNSYKKHRILMIYHFFVNLLLKEIKDGLGGAWAFVLRDVIYTMIHHISNKPPVLKGVSFRSFLLCCDLLSHVCHTAVQYCRDALGSHLHVIVGTLTPIVGEQPENQEEVLSLLRYLVIENKDNENLYDAIKHLDPFPDHPAFKELRTAQQNIKYSKGNFSLLEEINHFLSINISDSLTLTRLEGLNDLRKQLEHHKDEMKDLMKEFQENPKDCIILKLMACLLQLHKTAVNDVDTVLEAVGRCLGEIGPINFSTTALQHHKSASYMSAVDLFEDRELQWVFIILTIINNILTDQCIEVRSAAAACLKNILATKTGHQFWEINKSTADTMLIYLHPFRASKKKVLEVPDIARKTLSDLDNTNLWIPQNGSHDIWIKTLTCALLESEGVKSEILQLLKPLCEVQTDFCQTILPYLVHDILLQDSDEAGQNLLSTHVQVFFANCCKYSLPSSRSSTPANSDPDLETPVCGRLDKISRQTMLAVVDYLRRQKRNPSSTVFDDSFWLELNYLQVAMAAQSCAAHFTALLYVEIYADKRNLSKEQRSTSKAAKCLMFEGESQSLKLAAMSGKSKEETGISLQDLLMDIYRSIGEPDSLYGCGGGRMLQPLARIRTYEHEAVWGKALVTYDLETSLPPSTRQAGIIEALQNFGLCDTLSIYLKGLEQENTECSVELQEIRYQAAWRNMQWDQISSVRDELGGQGYHESLFEALQCLKDKEFSTFYERLKCARVKEVEELSKGSFESVYSLLPTLCRLQTIGELEYVGRHFSGSFTKSELNYMYLKWQKQSQLLQDSDFGFQEPIMALRTVILNILLEKENENAKRECIKDMLTKHLVELSRLARVAKNTQLPERAMFQIKQYHATEHEVSEWQLEEAQVFWDKKEESLALSILKEMIKKLDEDWSKAEKDPRLRLTYTECLRLCGNWLAETCLENPTIIMQNYLEKAVKVAGSQNGAGNDELKSGKMKAFLSLARFSDTQYQRIENYMKSAEFENKQALLKKAKEEVGLLREHKVQTNRYTVKVQRELELDERAIRALGEDRKRFLCKAVENYIRCLLSGEEHDMWIFRLCSLWLENSGVSEVNAMIQREADKIPSYKFLPLMYQLAARMGTKIIRFHQILNNLIARISLDHPHHTLFIILALANANKDELLTTPETARSRLTKNAPKETSLLDMDRMEAASNIINIIKHKRADMVTSVEALCDAYIILANMDATPWKTHRRAITIPSDQPITKLKDLENVVVPTMEIKVDPSAKYEKLVTIRSFKQEFRLAGGVNLPKIIDCVGSDGRERRQLVKGRDDLRQDAVMQQVFQMCNTLLQQNTETRKRKLTIRRYKVVPLSQRSGVLEWCTGTIPLGDFLINTDSSAHKRYRPKDYSNLHCQRTMMEAQKKDFEEKYTIFMDICQNFQPVFRYFCIEKFLDPAVWFEKRLAYTRSVATSSIVGYILGLGDRHVQNILLDEQTAELVHIDLGVAFEQGKILPTPETVPFRLTRDIVDGMGITGVEGVFRRCCEKTMVVMRNSQEALLTIVEVLLYDPLFDWTMNPLKALYLQQRPEDEVDVSSSLNAADQECNKKANGDNQTFNKVAERVLMRLQEKLKGVEEGTVLSVGGQVNLLIQQAMDPKNLSRLFPGWKAWV